MQLETTNFKNNVDFIYFSINKIDIYGFMHLLSCREELETAKTKANKVVKTLYQE